MMGLVLSIMPDQLNVISKKHQKIIRFRYFRFTVLSTLLK